MADITVTFSADELRGDFVLLGAGLATGSDLKTNVLVSLFTEAGWWANIYEPDDWGCRLLELRDEKRTNTVRLRAIDYCRKALAWMVEDGVAQSVAVDATWVGTTLVPLITISQPSGTTRFTFAWNEV